MRLSSTIKFASALLWALAAHVTVVCAGTTPSPSEIFKASRPSVVVIVGGNGNGEPTVQGSGFIEAQDRIVTNHHVVAGTSTALIIFSDGSTAPVTGVVADNSSKDLIVLVAKTDQRPALRLGDELSLQQGDPVYAIGAPQGLQLTLTNGIISAFRNIDDRFLIQATAAIGHGSSGGPLFDRKGEVVGITSSALSDTPGIYFSVGVGDLKRLLRTPQLLTLTFEEWAAQNRSATTAPNGTSSKRGSDVEQIEKLLADGKFDEAKKAVDELSSTQPDSEIVHRLMGELDERTGDLDNALKELSVSVGDDAKDAIAQFYYAVALYSARRFADALEHEQKSNELEPTASDRPLLALLYYSVQDYAKAQDFANSALAVDPKDATALEVMAGLSYHGVAGQRDTWKEYAARVAVTKPDSFWPHIVQGFDAYDQKQTEKSATEFLAAEKDDFPDAAPYLILATWYDGASDMGDANDQINAGLASVPDDPQLLNQGLYISLREHDNAEAGRRFSALEQSHPGELLTEGAGCLYYYGIGRPMDALPYCSRQVSMSASDRTAHSNYGWAALDSSNFALALQQFGEAYKIASPNWNKLTEVQIVDLVWGFAIADYNTGDRKHAKKLVQFIRKNYPSAATITGLQQMPLLWSATTMGRIETILAEFPK